MTCRKFILMRFPATADRTSSFDSRPSIAMLWKHRKSRPVENAQILREHPSSIQNLKLKAWLIMN
jgi:hypothetical protein